ncbi:DivIVA domain-containing protein [Xanthovirga aplysinae]|uniref:DivIVA domain-containing protein n=1 Tax=Xanthovirga aplysinae TaxID=2529853 RepID=UPI0012BD5E2C|nr:DivIVA domain-containing protein [Xanthovirga aplysinae]MTI33366.1 DivIVA domain-containing protein [Xanthovirga aplysinae]
MKITPLEIRQKSFEKVFRGYDKDEVEAFLLSLSHEWERHTETQNELKRQLETAEKELEKMREVERSLFKTLKTAEDTGANLIEQANKSADLHLREAHLKAEALMHEAKNKAKSIIEEAQHQANRIVDELDEEVRNLEQKYRQLENARATMLTDLKSMSNGLLERVNKMENDPKRFVAEDLVQISKQKAHNMKAVVPDTLTSLGLSEKLEKPQNVLEEEFSEKRAISEEDRQNEGLNLKEEKPNSVDFQPLKSQISSKEKGTGSFFDEIE